MCVSCCCKQACLMFDVKYNVHVLLTYSRMSFNFPNFTKQEAFTKVKVSTLFCIRIVLVFMIP